jgi:hypothetical protein
MKDKAAVRSKKAGLCGGAKNRLSTRELLGSRKSGERRLGSRYFGNVLCRLEACAMRRVLGWSHGGVMTAELISRLSDMSRRA